MPYLTILELKTHAYNEVVNEISRNDDSIMQTAINAAIEEAKSYLTNFDTTAIFNAVNDARNPIVLMYVKDIAVWHFINLGNAGIEYAPKMDRYEKAMKFFNDVQSGKANPTLPMQTTPPNEYGNVESFMKWGSNLKRSNNY